MVIYIVSSEIDEYYDSWDILAVFNSRSLAEKFIQKLKRPNEKYRIQMLPVLTTEPNYHI